MNCILVSTPNIILDSKALSAICGSISLNFNKWKRGFINKQKQTQEDKLRIKPTIKESLT